ncbi:MAG TPA: riboflavin synthase [Steroidobacteraceae bacterium]|nr:riboflavin synthase [Steroidobacteraceae bacterium]
MFTGIVQAIGTISALHQRQGDLELEIAPGDLKLAGARVGDSIAVSGVCLTIARLSASGFVADVSRETLACTTLDAAAVGRAVNLELALRAGEPMGGHLVAGHVDGVGRLLARREDGRSWRFEFAVPETLARYIAPKGSICIDGVSLTVNEVDGARFGVNLIPHTLTVTTLGALQADGRVNIEVDLLARYLERLAGSVT